MELDRVHREVQVLRDLRVPQTERGQLEDVELTRRELAVRFGRSVLTFSM